MFDNLKMKYMNEQLNRMGGSKQQSLGSSQYVGEIAQHQAYLDLHDNYQSKIESLHETLKQQQAVNRRLNEQLSKTGTLKEFEISQLKSESQQLQKSHEVELLYYTNEIQKLKSVITSFKSGKEMTVREKDLKAEIVLLQKKIEEISDELKHCENEIAVLRSQKVSLTLQLLKRKDQKINMNTSTETEMSSWKSKSEVAERMLREFELKYKAIKDQADRRGEELQEQRRLFANREDKFDRQLKISSEHYQQRLDILQSENRQLSNKLIKAETQLSCQQQLIVRFQEEIKIHRDNTEDNNKRRYAQNQTEKKKKSTDVRAKSEDPEKESGSKKQQSTRYIRLPPQSRDRIVGSHHCRCLKVDRYRQKLTEANEKIMQLLTDKCRMKLELVRTRPMAQLSLLEATGDLDNIVVL